MEVIQPSYYYHIYNRGNNKENIFIAPENYPYFLKLLQRHILPIADIYSYCLLKNHFHSLLRIKDAAEKPSQAFSNFFNAYTKAINKRYNRTGSLFQKPFRRKKVKDEIYLKRLIIYIHRNPEYHGFTNDFRNYIYSSYGAMFSNEQSWLEKRTSINLFDGLENFEHVHRQTKPVDTEINLE